ncbi:MAG: alpha-mannosidase [Calditrichaeota bacterium]|nr:alpha-mannosidase [Calditrichota bacterium]
MKTVRRILSVVLLGLIFSFSTTALASNVDELCEKLESLLSVRFDNWKFSTQMIPDGFRTNLNDRDWKTIKINDAVYPDSAWMRKVIVVPRRILGKKVNGGRLTLRVSVDDAGFCWINGEKKGLFKWTGEYLLTKNARAGEKFVVAIKAINTGGPMRLLEATLVWDQVKPLAEKVQNFITSLKVGQKLLSDDTYLKTGRIQLDTGIDHSNVPREKRLELRQILNDAAKSVDLKALENGNQEKFEQSLQACREKLKPVSDFAKQFTLVFDSNAHIDCAWLWRYLETINIAHNTFTSVLDMMDARPDFTYTQSQTQLFWWMENLFPETFNRIKARVNEGRWELVGGMWVEPDCNLISGESWARQLLYGKRYFKEKFGADVKIGWNPDSFGYNWNMPQFYRDAGIDAFITQKIGWNDTNMFPYRLFWWESPDGTRLLTYFPNSYVNEIKNPFGLTDWLRQFEANTGFKKLLVLYGVGDHGGGPDLAMIDRIEKLKKLDIYPRVEYGRATDYLNWIRRHDLSSLPVWKDELYLEYHRGTYTTQAKVKKYNRLSEIQFGNAEQLSSLANLFGRPYPYNDFRDGWRGVMFNQFHDVLPGSHIYAVSKDARETYKESLKIANHQIDEGLQFLARQINTKTKNNEKPLLIYNSLPWERTDVVELKIAEKNQNYQVFDPNHEEIPVQIVSAGRYSSKIIFIAKNVPATGYAVYSLKKGTPSLKNSSLKATNTEIESDNFRIKIDSQTGWLTSIFDKKSQRDYLAGPGNELQLFKDTPKNWDAWNIGLGERYYSRFRGIEVVEAGPVRAVVRVKRDFLKPGVKKSYPTPNNPTSYFTQDIILYNGLDRIDFCTRADWWEEHVMLKVAFAVTAQDSVACFEIPFGSIYRPTTMKNNWEKARFEVSQHKWSDLTDASKKFGVSLLNRSKYGGDIHGTVMRLSLLRSPKWPDPMADMGKHVIDYSIFPHSGDWKDSGTMRRSYEFNYPLLAQFVPAHKGALPKTKSLVSVSADNVILHSIKMAEPEKTFSETKNQNGQKCWILRVFEFKGAESDVTISLPSKVQKAVFSNILEEDGEPISFFSNKIEFKIPAHRITTLKVWF